MQTSFQPEENGGKRCSAAPPSSILLALKVLVYSAQHEGSILPNDWIRDCCQTKGGPCAVIFMDSCTSTIETGAVRELQEIVN